MAELPTWNELTDLDKGAALLYLHKRDWEGPEYAVENYPARYFEHPALTALSPRDACRHAVSVEDDAERAGALRGTEYQRLIDLALDADHARREAERKARGTAPAAAGKEESMKDYRIDGPDEAQQIVREHRACETAPNGTGSRCTCDFDCANYWLRAKGFKGDA